MNQARKQRKSAFYFVGSRWNNINKAERKSYLKNAYRVLLTRARQGMVIVVPEGDEGIMPGAKMKRNA